MTDPTKPSRPIEVKTCPGCGYEFLRIGPAQKYCDPSCQATDARHRRRADVVASLDPIPCRYCHTLFQPRTRREFYCDGLHAFMYKTGKRMPPPEGN